MAHNEGMIHDLPPADSPDPVIEFYKKDVDRTLLRENLKLTPDQRMRRFVEFMRFLEETREAGDMQRQSEIGKAPQHGE